MRKILLFTILTLLGLPVNGVAQTKGALEFGLDTGLAIDFIDGIRDDLTEVHIPERNVRIGIFTGNNFKIEPNFGLVSFSGAGSEDRNLVIGLDIEYLYQKERGKRIPFVGAGIAYQHSSGSGFDLGRFGVKGEWGFLLSTGNENLYVRVSGRVARWFESQDARARFYATTILGLQVGISIFTR